MFIDFIIYIHVYIYIYIFFFFLNICKAPRAGLDRRYKNIFIIIIIIIIITFNVHIAI